MLKRIDEISGKVFVFVVLITLFPHMLENTRKKTNYAHNEAVGFHYHDGNRALSVPIGDSLLK